MATWQHRVSRYDPRTGRSRVSGIDHFEAADFPAAVARANDRVAGMKAADPECRFETCHLLSHDYRGEDCTGGIRPFETAEEMSERLAEKAGAE